MITNVIMVRKQRLLWDYRFSCEFPHISYSYSYTYKCYTERNHKINLNFLELFEYFIVHKKLRLLTLSIHSQKRFNSTLVHVKFAIWMGIEFYCIWHSLLHPICRDLFCNLIVETLTYNVKWCTSRSASS